MADQLVPTLVVAALVLLALLGMVLGWRARIRRQAHLDRLVPVPELGTPLFQADTAYVATTLAQKPLERIAAAGLGVRGRARIEVHREGVLIDRTGARAVYIPAADIDGVGLGTFTVDRVVERDGLAVVSWRLGETPVDTYLRPASVETKRAIVDAVDGARNGSLPSNPDPSEGTPRASS